MDYYASSINGGEYVGRTHSLNDLVCLKYKFGEKILDEINQSWVDLPVELYQ